MPWKLTGPCNAQGCPNRATCAGYCAEHQALIPARKPDTRASAAERGYDAKWRKYRASYLKRYPYCAVCNGPATEVDHIVPLSAGGSMWDTDNHQPLCKSHHSQKTMREMRRNA